MFRYNNRQVQYLRQFLRFYEFFGLNSIFTNKIFRIPDFQRGYAWQQEHLKDFWEDLVNLSDGRFHYTGVLTLKQIQKIDKSDKEHWLVEDHAYNLYHIVDGQQRLTTFVIFLQAFVNFVKGLEENTDKSDDLIYISGSISVANILEKYLFRIKPTGDKYRTYKFGYTIDNPSDNYLRHKILGESGGGSMQETFYTLNLSNAKQYFTKQFEELHSQEGMPGLAHIYKKLTESFLFNEYIIADEFDVFVAFETMNNRGKKLSNLELLKNRLIYLTTLYSDGELDESDRQSLRDTINNAWKEVYHQLGRNKTKPLNDDDFLRAHWTMYFRYSRNTAKDYILFLLNEQFTPKKVHKKIEREIVLELPMEQVSDRDFEDSEGENGDVVEDLIDTESSAELEPIEIRDFVENLKDSAVHWFNSFYPDMAGDMSTEEQQWIDRLNRIGGLFYFRPLVMAILKNETDEKKRIDIFEHIERFIFIAYRMMAMKSNYKSSVFCNAAREIDREGSSCDSIKEKIREHLAFAFSEDRTLRIDDFFNSLRKKFEDGSGYYGWYGLRYFLFEYELSLLADSRQKKVDWSDLLKTEKDKISIEHIYPQTETDEWAKVFKEIDTEIRRRYSATLGNLLLLSSKINSSLQNNSFSKKKEPQYNNSEKKIRNGYSDGSHSEIEVAKQECWGPQQIYDRGIKLLNL